MRGLVVTLATGWAIVWLMAQRLSTRSWFFTCLLVFFVMLAVGLLSYACSFGGTFGDSGYSLLLGLGVYYALITVSLLLPMAIAGRCCGKAYAPGRFMAWLFLCMLLAPSVGMTILVGGLVIFTGDMHMLLAVPVAALMGGVWGVMLYLLNLPFMLLAFRNGFYRQRFCRVFGLVEPGSPFAAPRTREREGRRPSP